VLTQKRDNLNERCGLGVCVCAPTAKRAGIAVKIFWLLPLRPSSRSRSLAKALLGRVALRVGNGISSD